MTDEAATILVVEDDDATRTFLADNLTADGYDGSWPTARATRCASWRPSSPTSQWSTSGCRTARAWNCCGASVEADGVASELNPATPMLVVSGRDGELDRVRGFEAGLTTTSASRSATASCDCASRRCCGAWRPAGAVAGACASAIWRSTPPSREVLMRGRRVELSQKEFSLLRTLASDPTKVWSKEELLRPSGGFGRSGSTRTLDSHACRLRQKLGVEGDRFVINVWGVGYRLIDPAPHMDPLRGSEPARRPVRFAVPEPGRVA